MKEKPDLTRGRKGAELIEDEFLRSHKAYANALAAMKDLIGGLSNGGNMGIRRTLRIVQNMAEQIMDDRNALLAMSTIRLHSDYLLTHSVNVSILAMCLGRQIGLSGKALEELGISGLFHDLGKIMVPQNILKKRERLGLYEIDELKKHPLNSVRLIARLRVAPGLKAKIIRAPFEHHLKYNLQGYPSVKWKKPVSLFGRILAVADVYDALTSPRNYRRQLPSPDRALAVMLKGSGRDFDPLILKAFIHMIGIYPVGTVLQFVNDKMGLVRHVDRGAESHLPAVVLLEPKGNGAFIRGAMIKLSARPEQREYAVKESFHPAAFNIQPAEFLTSRRYPNPGN